MTTQSRRKPAFVSQYIGIDSHLTERNGSTEQVYGIAAERPAGRKLAQDIAEYCNQLASDGYEVVSIFPLTSGRTVEASAEAAERVSGRTYTRREEVQQDDASPWYGKRYEDKHYVDTSVGYSVTDGVIITARLRKTAHSPIASNAAGATGLDNVPGRNDMPKKDFTIQRGNRMERTVVGKDGHIHHPPAEKQGKDGHFTDEGQYRRAIEQAVAQNQR